MAKKTYVLRATNGRYYQAFYRPVLAMTDDQTFVVSSPDVEKAKRFRTLCMATHRAKALSSKGICYYYVYEEVDESAGKMLVIRNEQAIEKIRRSELEATEKIERLIAEWKIYHKID